MGISPLVLCGWSSSPWYGSIMKKNPSACASATARAHLVSRHIFKQNGAHRTHLLKKDPSELIVQRSVALTRSGNRRYRGRYTGSGMRLGRCAGEARAMAMSPKCRRRRYGLYLSMGAAVGTSGSASLPLDQVRPIVATRRV